VAEPRKKQKKDFTREGTPEWMLTYGDMTTLLLTFFVLMFTTATVDGSELRLILAAFQGLGARAGGNTLQVGRMVELGNSVMALPSQEKGKSLAQARKEAVSLFQPEIRTRKVRVKEDERGLVISLPADSFFRPASAEVDIDSARGILQKVAGLLRAPEMAGRKFRIEGHTDSVPTDPRGDYATNWELSAQRAINTLKYLVEFGVNEKQFQVAGFADTVPLASNDTPEGRAYNRRVDIVVLSPGHL
jgi:chemotaxis protein MotB